MDKNASPHYFIAIEGIDGVGKSTVAKALCRELNAFYYKTPPAIFESFSISTVTGESLSLRKYVDTAAYSSPHSRFLFYLYTLTEASREIRSLLSKHIIVCDRYLSSTLAYHQTLAPELKGVDISWLDILKPDYEYLLTINNIDELERRLSGALAR